MKKILSLIPVILICMFSYQSGAQQMARALTDEERTDASKLLTDTYAGVLKSVTGLSAAQLNFKPALDKWSIRECVQHIAAAEEELWKIEEENLKQVPNPERRPDIRFNDEQLIKAVEDRTHKSKTFEALEPAHSKYATLEKALDGFKAHRNHLIDFVKNTKADLRNRVLLLPLGNYDAYQFILLIAAHSDRHTQQINEVKANPGFPKK